MAGNFLLQRIFPTQGSNPGLPHCGQTLYRLSHQGSSRFFIVPQIKHNASPIKGIPSTSKESLGFRLKQVAAAKSLQSCLTLCDPIGSSPPGSPHPWDSLGKNIGAGCHFLLQCMKVKSESEVTQSCLTLRDPMDCSPPGSSVHGMFQARVLEWGAIVFSKTSGQQV